MSRSTYTFSRTRAIIHIVLLACSAGGWLMIGGPWELYRLCKK